MPSQRHDSSSVRTLFSGRTTALALAVLAGTALAQAPAHAVPLNPTVNLQDLQIRRNGDTIHAVFRQIVTSQERLLRYCRSPDGGRTWPQREVLLGTTTTYQNRGNFVVDGNDLHVALDNGAWAPHVISSRDGGLTWQAPVMIDTPGTGVFAGAPRLHASNGIVTAIWTATMPGGPIVMTRRSPDGGASWPGPAVRLDLGAPHSGLLANTGDSDLRLFAEGNALHVFWARVTHAGTQQQVIHTCHQRSLDGGATWLATPTIVTTANTNPLQDETWQPAAVGAGVLLVGVGPTVLRSVDQGATWQPVPGFTLGPMRRIHDLHADGSNVFAFGRQGNQLATNASPDGGITWRATPYMILVAMFSVGLQGAVAGGSQFLSVYYPQSQFLAPVFVQSDDFCNNWRLVADQAVLAHVDGDLVLATALTPPTTLSAFVAEGHTTLGQGSAGTGGVVPMLHGRGLPGLGRSFALAVSAALPGAPIGVFVDFGPTTAVPLGPATLYLAQPMGPFLLTGSASGLGSLSVTVPANPALAGLRMASQAFVLDPGVAAGFAATRAVETWVR